MNQRRSPWAAGPRLLPALAMTALLALSSCGKRETSEATPSPESTSAPASTVAMASSPGGEWNSAQIDWQPYEAGLRRAQTEHKPVLLVVSAAWCPHCKNFSRVFDDPRVVAKARDFVMVHIDSDAEPEVAARNAVDGGYIPRTFFLGQDGRIAKDIHPSRPRYLYFYDERDPASLLDGMATAMRTLHAG